MNETIHGFAIIAHYDLPKQAMTRKGRIILVDRDASGERCLRRGRFVTGWQGLDGENGPDKEWGNGHYFDTLDEARADFQARARRG